MSICLEGGRGLPIGVDAMALRADLEKLGKPIGLAATLQHENIFAATNDPRPVRIAALKRTPGK